MSDEPVGFWSDLRRRIVVISTMERDVRITFAVGSVVAVVAVAINLFGRIGQPVETIIGEIPLGTLLALGLGEFVVFTLLAAGLLESRGRVKHFAHAAIALVSAGFVWANDADPFAIALVVPFVSTWILSSLRERRAWPRHVTLFIALGIATAVLSLALIAIATGRETVIVSLVALQALFAMLGLFMSSTDLAEIASAASDAVVTSVSGGSTRAVRPVGFAAIAIAGNVVVAAQLVDRDVQIESFLGAACGLAILLVLTIGVIRFAQRRLEPPREHVRYGQLFLVVVTYFLGMQGGILTRILDAPNTYEPTKLFTYPEVFVAPAITTVVGVVLLFTVGRRRPEWFAALVFTVWVGTIWFHYYSSGGGHVVVLPVAIALASTVVSSLLVLVSVSSHLHRAASNESIEGVFESEPLVATGLILFAPAFFLTMLAVRHPGRDRERSHDLH